MSTQKPNALDIFLDELDKKAQEDGYPHGIVSNMRHCPEMVEIMIRMIGAEMKAILDEKSVKSSE